MHPMVAYVSDRRLYYIFSFHCLSYQCQISMLYLLGGPREGFFVLVSGGRHRGSLVGRLRSVQGVRDHAADDDGAARARELDEVVGVVGDRHELGEGGVAENGVVGQADVRDVEVDQLSAVVGLCAKGDCEPHLPQRSSESLCHP